MGTIKIGSAKNKQGITVNPSVVLFNGKNVQELMRGETVIWSNSKPLIPVMTSNTTPSGVASASNINEAGNDAYKAFDNDNSSLWSTRSGYTSNQYLRFMFGVPSKVTKAYFDRTALASGTLTCKVQASNDAIEWVDISDIFDIGAEIKNVDLTNNNYYMYYQLYIVSTNGYNWANMCEMQLYGKQLKGLIPQMTSNTTPSGAASASSIHTDNFPAWKAFDGNDTTSWISNASSGDNWICYDFGSKKTLTAIKLVRLADGTNMTTDITADIQVLADDNSWETVQSVSVNKEYSGLINLNNRNSKAIRILQTSGTVGMSVKTIQVYK